jgi:hypothetical protein
MPLARPRPHLALYGAALLVLAMAVYGPIPQLANYHAFADQRVLAGVPHAGDVWSNLGFLIVAAYGALRMWRTRLCEPAHALFVGALALTAAGSTWYHRAPDDARLVWDRLPIALACAALLAAGLKQAYPKLTMALPLLVAFAALSVPWWSLTGDLRPYLLIQAAPLLLIPMLQWQARAPLAQRTGFIVAIALYVLAKMFELADAPVFQALGVVSGHTVKHLLAALAAFVLTRVLLPVHDHQQRLGLGLAGVA